MGSVLWAEVPGNVRLKFEVRHSTLASAIPSGFLCRMLQGFVRLDSIWTATARNIKYFRTCSLVWAIRVRSKGFYALHGLIESPTNAVGYQEGIRCGQPYPQPSQSRPYGQSMASARGHSRRLLEQIAALTLHVHPLPPTRQTIPILRPLGHSLSVRNPRSFSTTPPLHKQKNRSHSLPGPKSSKPPDLRSTQTSAASKPLEDLQARIEFLTGALRASLAKLRASSTSGATHSAAAIESTRLELRSGGSSSSSSSGANASTSGGGGGNSSSSSTVRVADLAQVVQRGRQLLIHIGDETHIKPVLNTLQGLGLPGALPVPGQKLQFTIAVPAPTAESRKRVADEAGEAEAKSAANLRNARGECKKTLARLAKGNEILPDELREMEGKMEGLVRGGVGEFRGLVEGARKAILQP